MVRYGLKPIIFILNNYGYTIERFILGKHAKYNDVHNWQYTKLMEVLMRIMHIQQQLSKPFLIWSRLYLLQLNMKI